MEIVVKGFEKLSTLELYKILKLRTEVFVVEQKCPYLETDGKDLKSTHFYLKDNDEIIAYLRVIDKNVSFDEISIGRFLVKLEYRGHGYGKELIMKAIDYIKNDLHETKIKIEAQTYLIKFYESLGFVTCSEEFLDDGIPHVEMINNLISNN